MSPRCGFRAEASISVFDNIQAGFITQRMRRLGGLIRDFSVIQKFLKNFTHQFQIIRVARYGKFYGLQHMVNFIFHNKSIPK